MKVSNEQETSGSLALCYIPEQFIKMQFSDCLDESFEMTQVTKARLISSFMLLFKLMSSHPETEHIYCPKHDHVFIYFPLL